MIIAGVCLLVVLTIAECRFDFSITPSAKQIDDCGDVNDTSSKLGQCIETLTDDYDYEDFCCSGCIEELEDYFDCLGVEDDQDAIDIIDGLKEVCDAVEKLEEGCDAVTVTAISTVTAILVAIAAALN